MASAYQKATRYADVGTVRLYAEIGENTIDETSDFSVTFVRPNQIRAHLYDGILVSDGKQLFGSVASVPGEVLSRKAPKVLTLPMMYADPVLAQALTQGPAGPAPQPMLLMQKGAAQAFLKGASGAKLLEPAKIDEREHHRVEISRPDGEIVLWIDRETHVLRRIELPTDGLRQVLSKQVKLGKTSLIADFKGARFDQPVDPKAFRFEAPSDAKQVSFFTPPHPAQLLTNMMPPFEFVDLDGKPLTPESLAGKVTVMDFWATWCGPCRMSLPELEKVYQKFKDNPKVAFLAVSVDQPQTPDASLRETMEQLGVTAPIVRDAKQQSTALFKTTGIPSLYVFGADGLGQYYKIGGDPKLAESLPPMIEELLAGKNIYQKAVQEYQKQLQQYEQSIQTAWASATRSQPDEKGNITQQEIPRAEIAEKSEPKTLKLTRLWMCADVKLPGNILTVPPRGGSSRIFVLDAWKRIVELGPDGKILAKHQPELPADGVLSFLRTGAGADGKRYYVGSASAQQQLFLFDENWKLLLSYPRETEKNPHAGIGDVAIADLDGDGILDLYVGYWGMVGVQGVSLQGKRLWANRSVSTVMKLAVTDPDAEGQRRLLAANQLGSLAVLDAKGASRGEVTIPNRPLHGVVAADLDGDGKSHYCGLSPAALGDNTVVSFTLQGKLLWSYDLPRGVPGQPVEPIVPARLTSKGPGQWLLAGPDGSIHVVSLEGKRIDSFHYGAPLTGLAAAELDGRPVLLISSPDGVEALKVEQ